MISFEAIISVKTRSNILICLLFCFHWISWQAFIRTSPVVISVAWWYLPTSVLDMKLIIWWVRLQPWRFGECRVSLHWQCSQTHSDLGPINGSNRTNYVCKQMTDVKFWQLYSNIWNHLSVYKKGAMGRSRMLVTKWFYKSYLYLIYMRKLYLPTPPLGQDMTKGQFLSGV